MAKDAWLGDGLDGTVSSRDYLARQIERRSWVRWDGLGPMSNEISFDENIRINAYFPTSGCLVG